MVGGRRISITTRYVLVVGILLFLANVALGIVVLNQSSEAMRELINKNMLDVVKSAAGSLDGDVLGALTKEDVDGPVFCDIEDRLLVFQNSVDIEFIYAVKQVDEDTYVFTVDPDPVDPGAFGEEIVTTPALVQAAKGVPTVDSSPAADRWGNFYSAYSPVFDSSGKVAGIVGVDFDAQWYDEQVEKYTLAIAGVTSVSVLLGGVVVVLISRRVRLRFRELDEGLSELSDNVDLLMGEMSARSGFEIPPMEAVPSETAGDADELEILSNKICAMQAEMTIYLDYLHAQAYTDALTQVANSTAYHQAIRELDEKIAAGTADFWVAVFDINSLKELNDDYGHENGNRYIKQAAKSIATGMEGAQIYRIGGDEFAVIAEGYDEDRMKKGVRDVEASIAAFNVSNKPCPANLAISQGMTRFVAGQDGSYREVFARADQSMYENKRAYYSTVGDRRGRGRGGQPPASSE